jgi:putative peptide zinc metalloprotease protein
VVALRTNGVRESLFSASWYRVATLRPRLREDLVFHRHVYRGEVWQVLQEPLSGRCHRLSPAAQRVVGLMDGERTTQAIWERACEVRADEAPTQDETIRLLALLHAADLLACDVPPDTAELLRRQRERADAAGWRRRVGPLSQRVALLDPDRGLARALPLARLAFGRAGAALWCALVGAAALASFVYREDFVAGVARDLLEPGNLLLMALVYPVVKALHEIAHGLATKVWGGEVHEMGIVFLLFFPVPYVDASAATVFPDKWRRACVGAAGIAAELAIASLALFVWLAVEPGAVRALALAVITTSGVSTLLFNGNPLLRYDGYYVLADLIEIPNLDARARQLLESLLWRHVLGPAADRGPVTAAGEKRWLVGYGLAALVYRPLVTLGIALYIGGRFPSLGIAIAVLALASQIALPLARHGGRLLAEARLRGKQTRAIAVSAGWAVGALALLFAAPLPSSTRAQGVVWPPDRAEVRARADGFVVRLLADPESAVRPGDALVELREPVLDAEIAVLGAQRREIEARRYAGEASDAAAEIAREELATLDVALARARERAEQAVARSEAEGTFVVVGGWNLVGRYVHRGDLLGYVLGPSLPSVRVAVGAEHVAEVRDRLRRVEVLLSRSLGRAHAASITRIVPGATHRLPSSALGASGGGPFAVDPADEDALTTLDPFFLVDLALPAEVAIPEIGGRVYVRFEHDPQPLAIQGWNALRRLFLRRIGV